MNFRRPVIIAELWRPEVARPGNFLAFFAFCGKTNPCGTIFKILFLTFTWRHRLRLLCLNVAKFVRRKMGEIVRYLPHREKQKKNKISATSQTVAIAWISPKIYQSQPAPTHFQTSSQSVYFRPSYNRRGQHRFLPRGYFHDSPEAKHRFGRIKTVRTNKHELY